jgi:hypothetical protein
MKKILILLAVIICLAFSGGSVLRNGDVPLDFKIDTIKINDDKRGLTVLLTIPVSNVYSFDTLVRHAIIREKDDFVDEVEERYADDSTDTGFDYSTLLESAYRNKNIISYNFASSQYYNGAVHGMSVYRSFTFDVNKGRLLTFEDCFALRTKKDTLSLIKLLTKRVNVFGASVETIKGLHFHFTKDSITFNFDDYEIASYAQGMLQAKFALKELNRYLRK